MGAGGSVPTPTLVVDGFKIAYTAAGDPNATPLIMAHGWLSHHGVWRQTIEAFEDRYYCAAMEWKWGEKWRSSIGRSG